MIWKTDPVVKCEPLSYSSKIRRFINYLCMELWQINPKYSLRPRVEYLYLIDNSKMAEYYSILGQILFEVEYFNREPSFFASPTIRLRLQRFVIRLDDKSQSGTQLHRSLVKWSKYLSKSPVLILFLVSSELGCFNHFFCLTLGSS